MSEATTDYLAAIAHLPSGAVLRVDDVSWEEYENLLADLGENDSVRIFYDQGRMEVMAPSSAHEKPKSVIHTLVTAIRDELDIDIESLGSSTLKKELRARGAEPDDSFYIKNAARVIGKEDIDLNKEPPPDLVVEIERTSAPLNKFSIYAELGVPEIWRISGYHVQLYLLRGGSFEKSPVSLAFPFLTAQTLSEFLVYGLTEGERKVSRKLRDWLREHQQIGS
ncbi:MAG TPA: Uma2 family endonuclease [Blastocatellia bacterium]|nr:Uma2 family endonuclease [Blastocatellia bacterium]